MKLQFDNNPYMGKSMEELALVKATLEAEREVLAESVEDFDYYKNEIELVCSAEVIAIATCNFQ